MLSAKWVRENLERVKDSLARRETQVDLDSFLRWDEQRRECISQVDYLKSKQNQVSCQIGQLKAAGEDASAIIQQTQELAARIRDLEQQRREHEQQVRDFLLRLPNIVHPTVPEKKNIEIRRWGEPRISDTALRNHQEIGELLGILDFKAAAKIAGNGFVVCKGLGARLERALINFMLDLHVRQGYTEIIPPFLTNTASTTGTAQLPKFRDDLYKCEKDDLYLIPTAEVPVTNLHADEILSEDALPLSYVAYTPCFRREAGAYGKRMQGMIRVHQFNKVELVKFTTAESSYEQLEQLTLDAEKVLQLLDLPYRVVKLAGNDLGFAAALGYDLEVWLPSQQRWMEISTCSNYESYQSRRASIKYRKKNTGKADYAHTLNGSGVAVGRCVVAILENFQGEHGTTVHIPDKLQPYMDGVKCIGAKEV